MSSENQNRALLPTGLHDLLPPRAQQEDEAVRLLLGAFRGYAYEQVKPPLVEFEATLLGNGGNGTNSLAGQMFRLMDPVSQQMMAVRADMTLQVARIAETRLRDVARPLRLSYAGQVLRVRGSQLRPERQFAQAGVELIGSPATAADVEVIALAAQALAAAGVRQPTVDLNSPALVANVLAGLNLAEDVVGELRAALDHKDVAGVRDILRTSGVAFTDAARQLGAMIEAVGPAEQVVRELSAIALPPDAAAEVERLAAVVAGVRDVLPEIPLTLDPVEYRGFEYQTGVSFTIFAEGVRGELGRGGRYITATGEPATGFSLFLDSIMRALADPAETSRLYLPAGTPGREAARLRAEGWIALAGLEREDDVGAAARKLGCSHVLIDGETVAVANRQG